MYIILFLFLSSAPKFLKTRDLRRKEKWIGSYEEDGFRYFVHYDRKRADKDRGDRERILDRISKEYERGGKINLDDLVSNRGVKRYLKIEGEEEGLFK